MPGTIAYTTLQVIPSMRGATSTLEAEGRAAGQRTGNAVAAGIASADYHRSGQSIGSKLLGGIATVTKGIAASGGVIGSLFAGTALRAGLARLTTIQDATASLTTIMGDAAKAGQLVDQIKKVVQNTPFTLDEFATAGKNLVAMNVPAEKVPGILTAIGEAAAASGKGAAGVDQITTTFGKIAATGKVALDQVWSISEAGVPALQILANGFGTTTAGMQKLISDGAVPAERAIDILTKGILEGSTGAAGATKAYAGTMAGLRETLSGSLGGFKASMARFGAAFLAPWMPVATTTLTGLAGGLDALAPKIQAFSQRLADSGGVERFVAWMKQLPATLQQVSGSLGGLDWTKLGDGLKAITGSVSELSAGADAGGMSTLTESFTGFGGALGALGVDSITLVTQALRSMGSVIGFLADHTALITPLLLTLAGAYATSQTAQTAFQIARVIQTPAMFAQLVVQRQLTAALTAHTAALTANTAATGVSTGVQGAQTAMTLRQRAAALASAAATKVVAAAQWLWNAAMTANPIGIFVVAIGALIAGIVLAYRNSETFRNIVQAAWAGIKVAVAAAWAFIQPIFAGLASWVTGTLAPAITGFWQGTIVPAFHGISAAIGYWWDNFASPMLRNFQTLIGVVGAAVTWWWREVAEPAFRAVGAVVSWWWSTIVEPAFTLAKAGIGLLGEAISAWWHDVVEPAFRGAGTVVSTVWQTVISPSFEALKSGIGLVGEAFGAAGRVIESVWSGVLGVLRPVAHAIGNALAGIPASIGPWEIPGAGAANDLGRKLQAFRDGGMVLGAGTGTSDSILARVSTGEFIEPADKVNANTLPILEAIRDGWVPTPEFLHALVPGFAGGGLVDAQNWAKSQAGKPYQYGATGPQTWDCSGFMGAIYATLTGKNPNTRYFTTESDFTSLGFLPGLGGAADFSIGVRRGGGGPNSHMAGTLGGLNVEAGSDGVEAGAGAAGAGDFPLKWHLPLGGDPGGMRNPGGGTLGSNGTGAGTLGGASGAGTATDTGGGSSTAATTRPAGTAVPVWVDNWPTNLGTGTSAPAATAPAASFNPGGGVENQYEPQNGDDPVNAAFSKAQSGFAKAGEAFARGQIGAMPFGGAVEGVEKTVQNINLVVADVAEAWTRINREQKRQTAGK